MPYALSSNIANVRIELLTDVDIRPYQTIILLSPTSAKIPGVISVLILVLKLLVEGASPKVVQGKNIARVESEIQTTNSMVGVTILFIDSD